MMEQMLTIADKLSEEIKNMQKCLQCTVCLHTITDPIKTLCGHRFCRACIQTVLQSKNALCPLCNCAIQRRSISKDEHMILYIDRLQKLIEAIQLDSGINILLHSSKPRSTRECKLPDNTELRRSDVEELTRPSCSYLDNSLRVSESDSRRRGQRSKGRGRTQTNKAKSTQKEGNTIRRYLSKCDLSGVGQLEKSKDFLREESAEAKVHKWLGNLGNLVSNDESDEPVKVVVVQPTTECDLDDTLAMSVSQNDAQNQDEGMEVFTTKNDVDRAIKQVRRSCSRNTNNEREPTNKRWSTETWNSTNNHHPSALNFSLDDSRPSTSAAMRSLDDSKERNIDVHRASTCQMLSNMQKNWSTVAKFGKEMRTRKKKLMSLNVSIESKKKSRRTEMNLNAGEKVVEDTDERQRRRGNESSKTAMNEESVNGKTSLIKGDFVRGREASPRDRNERSISEEVPLADESFVIALQKGRVPVQSLSSCQINAIIGVTEEDPTAANVETDESSNREVTAFPADGRVDPFDTPFRDRDKIFSQMTVSLSASEQTEPNLIDKPINERNCCPMPTIETIDVSSSATNYQTSTPRRKRLSLNRRSANFKLDDSSRSNVNSSIALQSVRRHLNRQIESEDDNVDKRSPERVIITEKHRVSHPTNDKPSGRRDGFLIGSSNEKSSTSSITFTKLGKTFRHCRKRIRFLYLGTTRQEAILSRYPGFRPQKPCNPVDMVDTQDFAIENYLEDNDQATVSDTQPMDEEPESIAEGNNSSKIKEPVGVFENQADVGEEDSCREVAEEIVPVEEPVSNNSGDIDILYVSLNESRVSDSPCTEQPAKSSNAPTKNSARMMSPVRDTMQSLSLESPTTIGTLQTQRINHELGEPSKEKCRASSSRDLSCTSDTSGSSYVLKRRSKNTNIREKLWNRKLKRKLEEDDEQGNRSTDHSFSSQATCIRNSDKEDRPLVKGSSLGEKSELSNPSTKDIDVVSLSSDPDIAPSERKKEKKMYKRILSFESSDGDSVNTGCCASNKAAAGKSLASDSAPTKRKRAVSPDSVNEDLCAIVNSWLEVDDRYRKKGKLDEQSRDSSDSSRDACRRKSEKDNASAKPGSSSLSSSSYRDKSANKLSTALQRRQRSDFSVDECNNREKATSFRRKSLEVREAPEVTDEDSPDFGATIDQMKVLLNRLPDLMQEDNFDDVIANVNTDTLVNECNDDETRKSEILSGKESIECLEVGSCEWKSKAARSYVKNPRSSSERVARVADSNGSDKENKDKTFDIVYGSDDENDEKTTVKVYVNSAKESSTNDKPPEETDEWISSKSPERFQSNPTTSPGDKNGNLSNSMVKDTYDQDSLMNITQQYLMIKQFEEDLFGKPESSKRGPQTPTGSKKCCNAKDVEHSAEEDDIVENTPSTKTKILEAISSTQRSSNSKITRRSQSGVETPRSRNEKSPGNFSTPGSKTNVPPLGQSTPKTCHSMTFIPRASQSLNKEARKNSASQSVQRTAVQSVQTNAVQTVASTSRRRYCFVSSGLESAEVDQLKKLARTLPDAVYHAQFNVNVTHVVVKTNSNNGASKTLKYLQGIVHRKWIVNYQWVIDSLKDGRAANEEFYEVVDCRTLEAGPRKSRLREKGLFEGFVFLCIGPYVNVSVEQYEDLLRATGAIVVDSLYALTVQANRLKIILIQDDIYEFQIIEWYKKARAIAIVHEWVVECISQYKLISLYPYLQELSRQDVLALGYPEYLVEEETGWESDSTYDV